MKIGILCRDNDGNLIPFIKKLVSQGEKNIFVIIERKIRIKPNKIKIWKNENFDLNFSEKLFAIIYYFLKKVSIKNKIKIKNPKDSFDAKFWCSKNNIRYIFSLHNSKETETFIKEEKINHLFLLSGGIIKNNILNIKNLTVYNAHPGRLPRHRGLGSLEWSIIEDHPLSATLHTINSEIDGGDIIKIIDFYPKKQESIRELKGRIINFKPTIFSELVTNIKNNKVAVIKQNCYEGIIHRKLTRRERKILQSKFSILKKNLEKSNA
ncbi:MAG: Methionyl-tRNA formyltransferase [Alphaproteobacteria bacterium MarineAlpha2_Bin1]|nr:MAG: Methionyl-tRNA formyltransferase [Alphaproteobacteria bacterium MarineAlpha2_Bin1]|tara:strand:- start:1487 stop:2284 length:798 start_codon:yes stop_codon:yes gene_type:complete